MQGAGPSVLAFCLGSYPCLLLCLSNVPGSMLPPDLLPGQPSHAPPLLQKLQSLGPQDLTKFQLHAWILDPSQFWPNFLNLSLSATFPLTKNWCATHRSLMGKTICSVLSPPQEETCLFLPQVFILPSYLSKPTWHTISCVKSALLLQVRTGNPISVLLSTLLLCTSAQPICLIILCVCLSTLLQVP